VVERWQLLAGSKAMEVKLRIGDSGAFKSSFEVTQRYHQGKEPWIEFVCAENPYGPVNQGLDPIRQATKSDF
jgi:hypothetical protein